MSTTAQQCEGCVPESKPTPRTDAAKRWAYSSPDGSILFESYSTEEDRACIEVHCMASLECELAEKDAQIVALREALNAAVPILDQDKDLSDAEVFESCGEFYIARRKALRSCQAALSTPPPPVVWKDEYTAMVQHLTEQATLNAEGIRDAAFTDARKGVHELHSPDCELIAKFEWEEENGDADVGMPGRACWVVTQDSPPVVPLEDVRPLLDAVKLNSIQKISSELYDEEHESADYETAYDLMIQDSRKALAAFTAKHPAI